MSYAFFIPGPLPGVNEILKASATRGQRGARGKPWGAYDRLKAEWTTRIALGLRELQAKYDRVVVHMHWVECKKGRGRDPDNIAGGGQKLILDGMVAAGVIPDDSMKHVSRLMHSFEVTHEPAKAGVYVTLWEDPNVEL